MKKYILITLLIGSLAARSMAESPLSSLGYGWQADISSARSAGMGLTGISAPDSLSLDLLSPANWQGNRTARFGFNGQLGRQTVADVTGSDASDYGLIGGIGFAAPVGKDGFAGFALTPYTLMDYRWRSVGTSPWSSTLTRRQGQGGLTQALIGGSFRVGTSGRMGLAVRPIFGKVERLWRVDYPDGGAYSSSQTISERFAGVGGAISGLWQQEGWGFGLSFNTPLSVSVQRQLLVTGGGESQVDSTYDLSEKYELPLDFTIGVSRTNGRHLYTLEGQFHGWGSVKVPVAVGGSFENGLRLAAGWERTPNALSLDPYFKKMHYRAGFYTTSNYALSTSGHQPTRFALTGGLGLPYAQGRSRVDLALEFGWAGDESKDGASERSLGITVGFNHSELWFVGRREMK